jgi:hypothetical protein
MNKPDRKTQTKTNKEYLFNVIYVAKEQIGVVVEAESQEAAIIIFEAYAGDRIEELNYGLKDGFRVRRYLNDYWGHPVMDLDKDGHTFNSGNKTSAEYVRITYERIGIDDVCLNMSQDMINLENKIAKNDAAVSRDARSK